MNNMELIFLVPIFFLLFLSITLGMYIYSNRQLLKELKDDSEENEIKMKNIIKAVNYNDTKLMENQKYLYDVYEENNNFENLNNRNNDSIENSEQYYNMMKNYDALIRLTK